MQTTQLKVYQDVVMLVRITHRLTVNFPRFEKYSIGSKLFNDSLELIKYIARANRDMAHRVEILEKFMTEFESWKTLLRIAIDERMVPQNALKSVLQTITAIDKQITGWKKSAAQKSRIG